MKIPNQIMQGETRVWNDDVQYDDLNNALTSADWTLNYALRGATGVNGKYGVDLVATPNGSGWTTTLQTTDSANLLGDYKWAAFVQKGTDQTTRIIVGTGDLNVLQNIILIDPTKTGYDGRTQLEKDLAAVDAAISARASGSTPLKYTIGSRQLENEPVKALLDLRQDLVRRLVRMRQRASVANGEGDPRTVTMRFRSPH